METHQRKLICKFEWKHLNSYFPVLFPSSFLGNESQNEMATVMESQNENFPKMAKNNCVCVCV